MKIIQSLNYNFKSNYRIVKRDELGKKYVIENGDEVPRSVQFNLKDTIYHNFTTFFRDDLRYAHNDKFPNEDNWKGFIGTIAEEFKDAKKVHTYNFGCSDGSETYSLILALIKELGEDEALKFFPIQAYDVDKTMIEFAKEGKISQNTTDVIQCLKYRDKKYFKTKISLKNILKSYPWIFEATDELKKKAKFTQGNALKYSKEANRPNSLVLCRNFMRYLSDKDLMKLMINFADWMDSNSLLVVGVADITETNFPLYAKIYGFEQVCPLIYKKKC